MTLPSSAVDLFTDELPAEPYDALAELCPEVQAPADELVDRLVVRGSFDAVADLAEVIPMTWVPDLQRCAMGAAIWLFGRTPTSGTRRQMSHSAARGLN